MFPVANPRLKSKRVSQREAKRPLLLTLLPLRVTLTNVAYLALMPASCLSGTGQLCQQVSHS